MYPPKFFFNFLKTKLLKGTSDASMSQVEKEEVDSRSVYVGNVRISDIELPLCLIFQKSCKLSYWLL